MAQATLHEVGAQTTRLSVALASAADNLRSSPRLRASWGFQVAGRKVLGRQSSPFPSHLWTGASALRRAGAPGKLSPQTWGPHLSVFRDTNKSRHHFTAGIAETSEEFSEDHYKTQPRLPHRISIARPHHCPLPAAGREPCEG